ncbi:MAG: hypothetical protein EYC70_13205 [Planctomycetota bacterium]|nr:MAG: hypothetical protein EYC70_13205 [Planctomycetota bacterium]
MQPSPSPPITHCSWGRLEADGRAFKDAKLYPGGARAWDWSETGTHHEPGIQVADVRELVENGAKQVVLSRGVHRRLQVPAETLRWLEQNGVRCEVLPTPEAVARYNAIRLLAPTGGLFHSTC